MPLNLIVVVFDTLRYDAVAGREVRTPHLDRFAAQSVVFRNAWGEGLPTIPFRRALNTGMRSYPWNQNVGDRGSYPNLPGWHAIPETQTTLPEHLLARGYATQLVSDVWHMFKPTMNLTRGFVGWEAIRGQEGDTYELAGASLGAVEALDGTRVGPASYLYQQRDRRSDDDYFVSRVLGRGEAFVRAAQGLEPFCLWVESFSPHEFWDPPLRYADAYFAGDGLKNFIVPQLLNSAPPGPQGDRVAQYRRSILGDQARELAETAHPDDIARTRALYQGYVTFCDERFGRFLDTLEQTGALNESIVVLLSDHGTELWDKGQFGKSAPRLHPYNTQMNLMIRHPDLGGRGGSCDAFVQNQDIAPTLLRLLGIPAPKLDGVDVWATAVEGGAAPRDHVVTGWDRWASVRDRDWNMILDTLQPEADTRLFDLRADPAEATNVAAENPDVVRKLARRLEATIGMPLPARYQHRPQTGFGATVGGLRTARAEQARAGERWVGSNQI